MTEKSRPLWLWKLRQKRIFRWSIDLLIFGGIFAFVMYLQSSKLVGGGESAPAFDLQTLDGNQVAKADLLGKPTVLFFWAPWCSVCKADAHNIAAMKEGVGEDVNVVSIALSYEKVEDVKAFAKEHAVSAPVLLGTRKTADDYHVDSFPTVYILNDEGNVSFSMIGYTTELGLRARLLALGVF